MLPTPCRCCLIAFFCWQQHTARSCFLVTFHASTKGAQQGGRATVWQVAEGCIVLLSRCAAPAVERGYKLAAGQSAQGYKLAAGQPAHFYKHTPVYI